MENNVSPKVLLDTSILENWERNNVSITDKEIAKWKEQIMTTLHDYGIGTRKITAELRPSVIYYEVTPFPGFDFLELKKHLGVFAVSLGSTSARIKVPTFGKVAIGIEIPREESDIVSAKELFESDTFLESKAILPIAHGKNHSNQYYISDLTQLHHILIAGDFGTDRYLYMVLAGLLYKSKPSELKLVLIDPWKRLNNYASLCKTFFAKEESIDNNNVVDLKQSVCMLNALVLEMDKRFEILNKTNTSSIEDYNEKQSGNNNNQYCCPMPYIVVVIEEPHDLILNARKEVEEPLAKLATLCHRVGMHLIFSTNYPTTKIVTSLLLVNFPARIAFHMSDSFESMRIIGQEDAEYLLIGNGDSFVSTPSADLIRCQSAYISDAEINRIVNVLNEQYKDKENDIYYLPSDTKSVDC